jgi:hypothetical protein
MDNFWQVLCGGVWAFGKYGRGIQVLVEISYTKCHRLPWHSTVPVFVEFGQFRAPYMRRLFTVVNLFVPADDEIFTTLFQYLQFFSFE